MGRYLLLVLGVFACSTSVIFIRSSGVEASLLAAYRLLLAALFLSPFFLRAHRAHPGALTMRRLARSVWPGALLAVHFISWNLGARMTAAANATLIVNLVPVAMPVLLFLVVQERINRREALGTVVALTGVAVLGVADFRLGPEYLLGDLVCFASMVLFAWYLVMARKNADIPDLWLYLVPLYAVAGVICLGVGAVRNGGDIWVAEAGEWIWFLALALVPTITGHSILNHCMKHLRGQIVSLMNLAQFIFAGLLAALIFVEFPAPAFYPASLLVVTGALFVIRGRRRALPPPD